MKISVLIDIEREIYKINDHFSKFFNRETPLYTKLSMLFSLLYYPIKIFKKLLKNSQKLLEILKKNNTTINKAKNKNILFDANVLVNGAYKSTARSGVYFVAYNILLEMLKRKNLNITLIFDTKQAHLINKVLKENKYLCNVPVVQFSRLDNSIAEFEYLKYENKLNKGNSIVRVLIKTGLNTLKFLNNFKLDNHYRRQFNDIDLFFSPWGIIPHEVKKNKKIKNYIVVHDVIPLLFPENFPEITKKKSDFYKLFYSFDKETFYFANSEYTKKDFISNVKNISVDKVSVIPLSTGIEYERISDKSRIEKIKEKYNIPKNKKYLFSLCSLEPRKNLIFAVKNFIEFIRSNHIDDFVFVLGGGYWDSFIEKLNATINDLQNFKDKIIKIGYVDDEDMSALYSGAEIFVFPSLYEGFGMPILEAMQCGCPVICSNVSSMPEVIGNCGIQINPKEDADLLKAFEKMYFDDKFRSECVEKGLERAKLFTWEKCVDEIISKMEIDLKDI